MNTELTLRISLAIIFLALAVIRIYYFVAGIKWGASFSTRRLGSFKGFLTWFLYGLIALLAVIYIFAPDWLQWAEMTMPPALRWFGIGIGFLSVLILLWVHRTLGNNFAMPGITQAQQTLVTAGPYRWVRHPMYTTFCMIALALVLTTANWFIAGVGLLFFTLMGSVTRIEEQTLIEKFGNAYLEYMKRTGRFLPRTKGESR